MTPKFSAEAYLVAKAVLSAGVQATQRGLPPADGAALLLHCMPRMLPPRLRLCCHRHLSKAMHTLYN